MQFHSFGSKKNPKHIEIPRITNICLLSSAEPHWDVEVQTPEWTVESPDIEHLRPLTPSGSLGEGDPDLLIRTKTTSPAAEEMERPQTPGRGLVSELSSADEAPAASPQRAELLPVPSELNPSPFQERPKTPGRDEKSEWTLHSCGRAPSTPGREMICGRCVEIWPTMSNQPSAQSLSASPYIVPPKTPGRDIDLDWRDGVHRRKTLLTSSSSSDCDDGVNHVPASVRTKPLQGLENMPGLLHREREVSSLRRKRLRRRWRARQCRRSRAGSLRSDSRPLRRRSPCEERRLLHWFWKKGLDEEDFRLLQCTYDRLQVQDDGLGWISDTLWTHHPHILSHKHYFSGLK